MDRYTDVRPQGSQDRGPVETSREGQERIDVRNGDLDPGNRRDGGVTLRVLGIVVKEWVIIRDRDRYQKLKHTRWTSDLT